MEFGRRLLAEFLGSAMLAGVVIGSGILAVTVSSGNDGVALLGNTAATAAMALVYILVQIIGCVAGALLAHGMFELPLIQVAMTDRSGPAKMLSEGVATFALVFAIFGTIRFAPKAVPAAVALVIAAGYWWTASTSFANPAITIARSLSDTFAGVRPADVPGFLVAQFFGACLATAACLVLFVPIREAAEAAD